MGIPGVETLSDGAKKWLAHAIAGMTVADGEVDSSELSHLREAIEFLDNKGEVEELMSEVREHHVAELSPQQMQKRQAFAILKELAQLAVADRVLSASEEDYLRHASELLGLPNEIAEKLIVTARKVVHEIIPAKLTFQKHRYSATCLAIQEKRCLLAAKQVIPPGSMVLLEIGEQDSAVEQYFSPISCRVLTTKETSGESGNHLLVLAYKERPTLSHGILHVIHPEQSVDAQPQSVPTRNEALSGILLTCYVCGNPKVPWWSLETEVRAQYNIFGIPRYQEDINIYSGFNFSFYRTGVCPECLFVSPLQSSFYRPGTAVKPAAFLNLEFRNKWLSTIVNRKREVKSDVRWVSSDHRNLDEGLYAWKLAAATSDRLAEFNKHDRWHYDFIRGWCLLEEAELFMQQGFVSMAAGRVQLAGVVFSKSLAAYPAEVRLVVLPVLALIALHDKQDSRHIELLVEFAELPVQLPADELRQKHEQLNAVISEFSKLSKGYRKGGHENFIPTDTHKGLAGVGPLLDFAHCAMLPSDGSAVSS